MFGLKRTWTQTDRGNPISDERFDIKKLYRNRTDISDINLTLKQHAKHLSQLPIAELLKYMWKLGQHASLRIFNDPKLKELYKHDNNEKWLS